MTTEAERKEVWTHLTWIFAALYVSEGWYDGWMRTGRLHNKARAVVLFDRCINGEHERNLR
jgi:hypothetical protein